MIALERHGVVMNEWRFEEAGKEQIIRVTPAMVCDDGKVSRRGHQHPVVRTDVADGQAAVRQITDANAHIVW
jgi:hypothetical protein